ncbi:hypothetical protein KC328_g2208 [Hortaea werneckii]|nr:hypothetical protein KC328_g2208 [Hortaea werneckii]
MAPSSTFVGLPVIPPEDPSLNATSPKPRGIQKVFEAIEQGEGAGATLRAVDSQITRTADKKQLHTSSKEPWDHEDFSGNKGTIESGDLQFMTAGKGIVHAEMPHDNGDGSSNVGMQLWVDLPKDLKSCEPRYRDLKASEIPLATADDGKVQVKVISGRSYGVDSVQELAYTPVWLLDATIQPGGKLVQNLPAGWNAFAYTLEGTTTFDTGATTQQVPQYHNTVFEQKGDQVIASVPEDGKQAARLILIAGMPLSQPVVQYGPFVLTDPSQVRQAMFDYSTYSNGFERARDWASEIGKVMM